MKFLKSHSLVLATLLSAGLTLSACSSDTASPAPSASPAATTAAETTAPSANPNADAQSKVKPIEFSMYVNYDWVTFHKWDDLPHTKWITENLKVKVDPIEPNGAAAQKLNSMIVSNELPDVIVLDRGKDVERLQQAGKLVALDPYLDKYPEFKKNIGEQTLNLLRSPDGKLYQLPNWFISGDKGNGNAAYIVEKKIYKALGSPKLETWDDLYAYLKMVKEKYPNAVPFDAGEVRDGADVQMVGMLYSGAANDRTPGFISPGAGLIFGVPDGNQLKSIYQDQAFLDTVTFASRLYRENLTTKDLFTQSREMIKEKLMAGRTAVFAAYDAVVEGLGREANNALQAKDPEDGYLVIWPIHKEGVDKNKVYPSGYSSLGWNVNVITKNAKDPEAIFAYMNWASSPEGQQVLFFGPPGMFYDKIEDGVPIPNDAYIHRDPKAYDELHIGEYDWNGNTSYVDGTKAKREQLLPAEAQDWGAMAQANISFKTSMNTTAFANLDPAPNSEEGIIMQRLKDQYKQAIAKMIFAKSDEEVKKVVEQTQQDAVKIGYDKVLAWKTKVWQDNVAKMGK
ncbi:extracellular solute-binding protein [Paenibacillus athensensis]|uniref:ABC transporter substrate-binding protein n=1 Tax=Paenibacillus athensensis TaxID=1967502 RepID=A0A4Y8PVL1_9BACL|nr:extracellular solute-binding protein [Paenibacillus athensensis]MCD1261316.1 extracellular solute-binding protein [Paenibacillus athensensis]